MKQEHDFMHLFDQFIMDSKRGKRLKKDGTLIRKGTIKQYEVVRNELNRFSNQTGFPLRINHVLRFNARRLHSERVYWKRFYRRYTDHLYAKGCFDNYTGLHVKTIRTFVNYLKSEKGIYCGDFHKNFYVRKESIDIHVLNPEQLQFLIYDQPFESSLPAYLKRTKDIFVFGCTVCLRFSDLMKLTDRDLQKIANDHYLKVRSTKTSTDTRIKLPDYAVDIIHRHRKLKTLLPQLSCARLNDSVKELCENAGWTHEMNKVRERRGTVKKVLRGGKAYRFCDLVTTHTMRRTAITTMLCLGMPEWMVRRLSGHAANSKDFSRYVSYAQQFIDTETEKVFLRLKPPEKMSETS